MSALIPSLDEISEDWWHLHRHFVLTQMVASLSLNRVFLCTKHSFDNLPATAHTPQAHIQRNTAQRNNKCTWVEYNVSELG